LIDFLYRVEGCHLVIVLVDAGDATQSPLKYCVWIWLFIWNC